MIKLTPEKLVFLFFLLFFIFVPNHDQGFDSYAFLLDARAGLEIVHPHHILYNVLRYILFHLSTWLGLDPMKVISLASSVMGATALTYVFKILKSKTLPEMALTGTMLIGMVYSFWYYSTTVEVNIASMMFLIISLYYLLVDRKYRNSFLAFLSLTVGILFHQLLALAVIPLLVDFYYRYGGPFWRVNRVILYLLLPGFIIYIIVAFFATPDKSVAGVYGWLVSYSKLGRWGIIGPGSLVTSVGGTAKALFGGSMLRQTLYNGDLSPYGLICLAGTGISLLGLAVLLGISIRQYIERKFIESTLLLITALIFAAFAFWWAPNDDGFWFYPVVLVLIMIFITVDYTDTVRKIAYATMAVFAFVNITCAMVPAADMNKSVARKGAQALYNLDLGENDLVLTNHAQIPLALDYHYNVKVPTTSFAYQEGGTKNEIISHFHTMLTTFKGRIIIFEDEIKPERHRRFLYSRFSPGDYALAYAPVMAALTPVDSIQVYGKPVAIYELKMGADGE